MNDTQRHTQTPEQDQRAEELAALLEQINPDKLPIISDYLHLLVLESSPDAPAPFVEDLAYLKSWLNESIETPDSFSWREFAAMIKFVKSKLHDVPEMEAAHE